MAGVQFLTEAGICVFVFNHVQTTLGLNKLIQYLAGATFQEVKRPEVSAD
jgi:hypothetical protein